MTAFIKLLLIGNIAFHGSNGFTNQSLITDTGKTYSKIDFLAFENVFWYASIGGIIPAKQPIIQGEFTRPKYGWARIYFFPKSNKQIHKLDSLSSLNEKKGNLLWAKGYINNPNYKRDFTIWAVFIDKKFDEEQDEPGDAGDNKSYGPKYPCEAQLYKKTNMGWELVRSFHIPKTGGDYSMILRNLYESSMPKS
jgi:hypothetical protein